MTVTPGVVLRTALGLAISAVAIFILVQSVDIPAAIQALSTASPLWVLVMVGTVFVDIAARAGVGTATVDRVLNKRPGVNPDTVRRVLDVVALLGAPAPRGRPRTANFRFAYVLPATFAIMFAKMASGLHVYYTVQNLAAIPQQWLLARERVNAAKAPVVEGPVRPTPASPAAPARKRA